MRMEEIRAKARDVAEMADKVVLAWAARAIQARKNDLWIRLSPVMDIEEVKTDSVCRGGKTNGSHDNGHAWRESWRCRANHISFPIESDAAREGSQAGRVKLGRELGLVRLFDPPVGQDEWNNGGFERKAPTAAEEQAARFYGLGLNALRGKCRRGWLDMDHIRFLASHTKSGIAEVAREYDEDFFGWFVTDRACPQAKHRFIGHVVSFDDKTALCHLREDGGAGWEVSFPRADLAKAEIDVDYGRLFKAFVVDNEERNGNEDGTSQPRRSWRFSAYGREMD